MATMSSARFRSLYRRRKQAYEAVYHFSANPVRQVVTGFSAARATETSRPPSADERSVPPSAARWRKQDSPNASFRVTSQLQLTVGVGIVITHNPLHGSGRADFPHPALALGNNAHAA